jgi:hypothetical protein
MSTALAPRHQRIATSLRSCSRKPIAEQLVSITFIKLRPQVGSLVDIQMINVLFHLNDY